MIEIELCVQMYVKSRDIDFVKERLEEMKMWREGEEMFLMLG